MLVLCGVQGKNLLDCLKCWNGNDLNGDYEAQGVPILRRSPTRWTNALIKGGEKSMDARRVRVATLIIFGVAFVQQWTSSG